MKIVYLINKSKNNSFANGIIDYMEYHFPNIEKMYYILGHNNIYDIPNMKHCNKIENLSSLFTNRRVINEIKSCDKIIVSGCFSIQFVLPFLGKQVLRKTYIQFWGGDLLCCKEKGKKLRKAFTDICLKYCAGIITLTPDEIVKVKDIFHCMEEKAFYSVPVCSSPETQKSIIKLQKRLISTAQSNHFRIVVGNSATESNYHLEAFHILSRMDISNAEIYCPLSYGDNSYRDRVIASGKQLFGTKFIPVLDYMDLDTYQEFLASCDIGLYNNKRQQGLGNISRMLNLGKKVYIRSDTPMWRYYHNLGYKINDIMDIKSQTTREFFDWPKQCQLDNMKVLPIREARDLAEWKRIIETI